MERENSNKTKKKKENSSFVLEVTMTSNLLGFHYITDYHVGQKAILNFQLIVVAVAELG